MMKWLTALFVLLGMLCSVNANDFSINKIREYEERQRQEAPAFNSFPHFFSLHGGEWGASGRLHVSLHTGPNHQVTFDAQPTFTTHNHRFQNNYAGVGLNFRF